MFSNIVSLSFLFQHTMNAIQVYMISNFGGQTNKFPNRMFISKKKTWILKRQLFVRFQGGALEREIYQNRQQDMQPFLNDAAKRHSSLDPRLATPTSHSPKHHVQILNRPLLVSKRPILGYKLLKSLHQLARVRFPAYSWGAKIQTRALSSHPSLPQTKQLK